MSDLLTTSQVADLLGLSPVTIHSWRQRGVGPAYVKLPTGTVRYDRREVDRYLALARRRPQGVAA